MRTERDEYIHEIFIEKYSYVEFVTYLAYLQLSGPDGGGACSQRINALNVPIKIFINRVRDVFGVSSDLMTRWRRRVCAKNATSISCRYISVVSISCMCIGCENFPL